VRVRGRVGVRVRERVRDRVGVRARARLLVGRHLLLHVEGAHDVRAVVPGQYGKYSKYGE
jgi:hypothetical protein